LSNAAKLSARADLVMDTLVARVRLGETFWTFSKQHRKAVEELTDLGFLRWEHGDLGQLRVWLEEPGRAAWMVPDYDPKRYLREEIETLHRHVTWLEQQAAVAARTRRAMDTRIEQLEAQLAGVRARGLRSHRAGRITHTSRG